MTTLLLYFFYTPLIHKNTMSSLYVFGCFKLHSFYLQKFFLFFTIFNLSKFYFSPYNSTLYHLYLHALFVIL
jgi:hypothetical protein